MNAMTRFFARIQLVANILLVVCLGVGAPVAAWSAEFEPGLRDIHRRLAANRSLLCQLKGEWVQSKTVLAENPTTPLQHNLKNLEIKIRALADDRQILLNQLPQEEQTVEMMKDILAARFVPKNLPASPVPLPKSDLSAPLHADTQDAVRAEMHLKALGFVETDKLLDAARQYEAILLLYPDDAEAALLLGHAYLMSGEVRKAESAYALAVKIDPENRDEIASFYENIILQNPSDDEAYVNLGFGYWIVGKIQKAREAFDDALSINPSNTRAQEGLTLLKNR